jgi:hypothetical protein
VENQLSRTFQAQKKDRNQIYASLKEGPSFAAG